MREAKRRTARPAPHSLRRRAASRDLMRARPTTETGGGAMGQVKALRDFRTCFVIMPFRKKRDRARRDEVDFDAVYRKIIKPAVESLNQRGIRIKCVRCDEIERAGLIHERMLEHIADADVAVVDITTQNPNVFYELGVR